MRHMICRTLDGDERYLTYGGEYRYYTAEYKEQFLLLPLREAEVVVSQLNEYARAGHEVMKAYMKDLASTDFPEYSVV